MLVFCFPFGSAQAQAGSGSHARSVVTQNIDEEKLVTLHGNTRPEAKAEHDQGAVDDNLGGSQQRGIAELPPLDQRARIRREVRPIRSRSR